MSTSFSEPVLQAPPGQEHLPRSLWTIDQADLAAVAHVTVAALYDRAHRRPHLLPPAIHTKGGKRLYRVVDVEAWLANQVGLPSPKDIQETGSGRRRGRPCKAEQVTGRKEAAAGHPSAEKPKRRGAPTKEERVAHSKRELANGKGAGNGAR